MIKIKFWVGLIGVAALLAACGDESTLTAAPIINTTLLGTAQPGIPLTSAPTLAAMVSVQCVPSATPATPAKPAVFTETVATLTNYLNAGASLSASVDLLRTWGYIYTDPTTKQVLGGARQVRVLPGEWPQTVLAFLDPAQTDPQNPLSRIGELAVLACVANRYQVAYQATADPIFLDLVLNPRVFSDEDVTGDGIGDLSFLTGDCGAGNCVDAITIVSTVGAATPNTLNTILPDIDFITQPYPVFQFVPSANGAAKNLWVTPGFASGAGAGPQRTFTETWSFNGSIFTQTSTLAEPPVYRIHALQDGDEAFRRKEFAAAEALYARVISDPSLQAWEGEAPLKDEARVLAAFAYARLIQIAAAKGDAAGAKAALDALQTFAPQGSSGEIYAGLGNAFFAIYSQTNDAAQACAAAIAFANASPNTYQTLGVETYGFNNADYMASDMCIQ